MAKSVCFLVLFPHTKVLCTSRPYTVIYTYNNINKNFIKINAIVNNIFISFNVVDPVPVVSGWPKICQIHGKPKITNKYTKIKVYDMYKQKGFIIHLFIYTSKIIHNKSPSRNNEIIKYSLKSKTHNSQLTLSDTEVSILKESSPQNIGKLFIPDLNLWTISFPSCW